MELSNSFEVERPIDEAWEVLTDVERIAPCLPGAKLEGVEGDEYHGIVKVKVGPITAQYKGTASFVEQDDTVHRAVLKADGRDTRGAGNASALITARAEALGPTTTRVDVDTDMTVTGKVAQFGRGVMADVSAKLMGQFADNLGEMLAADRGSSGGSGGSDATGRPQETAAGAPLDPAPADSVPSAPETTAAAPEGTDDVEAVDLIGLAGVPVLKRLAPLVLLAVVIVIVIVLIV